MSLMQCKDHSLLLEGKTLGMPDGLKQLLNGWVDGEISYDDFTKNVNFLRNEGLLGPR
jgi:hypothetical protein